MRLYRACRITDVTCGVTVVVVDVRTYLAKSPTIVTGGITCVGVNVGCNIFSLLTY